MHSCDPVTFVCVFLPVLPKPQVSYKTISPGVIESNCTSVSRPPAEIVWNVERDNRTMGPPVTTQLPQSDGTTLVISTLTVQSGLLKDVSIKCLVHHKGLESPIAVSMNTKSEFSSCVYSFYACLRCSKCAPKYIWKNSSVMCLSRNHDPVTKNNPQTLLWPVLCR